MPYPEPLPLKMGIVNAYLLRGAHGDVLIDTGPPGAGHLLLAALKRHGSRPGRLALIIITHAHIDHIGNLAEIQALSRAPVLAHRLEADLMTSGRVVVPDGHTPLARALVAAGRLGYRILRLPSCRPDLMMDEHFSLSSLGLSGRVIHTPGHTRGSVSVLLDGGHGVVGDLCQNRWGFGMGMGRIIPPLADVPEALPGSYQRLLDDGVSRVYPSHGTPFAADLLRAKLAAWRYPAS